VPLAPSVPATPWIPIAPTSPLSPSKKQPVNDKLMAKAKVVLVHNCATFFISTSLNVCDISYQDMKQR
jgi:hypothetical protein